MCGREGKRYLVKMPQPVDSLVHARWVVPVEPDCRARTDHCVVIDHGHIADVLPSAQARQQYTAREEVTLPEHALIPGLVNTHTHAAMTLFRGFADDLPLMVWLNDHIWPAESRWVSESFVRDGTRLAAAEMIMSGTTCFNDMYFFPDIVARVAQDAGIRACIGLIMIDFPTAWAKNAEEYLHKAVQVHDEVRDIELISTAFAPHAPYTVSDAALKKIKVMADELDIPVHIHLHETQHEIDESLSRHGVRPLERLSRLGLLTDRLLAVHATQLLGPEITAMAEHGVHVIHCPESNLKLASGMCPVHELLGSGVNVAMGTDGAASNDDLDMLGEIRTAALLAKGVSGDPTAVPAEQALAMATINGARALGLDDLIGSLRTGKSADMVAVDLGAIATQPVYDPVAQLVYSASRGLVSDVWIAGRRRLRRGVLIDVDVAELRGIAKEWASRLRGDTKVAKMHSP